MKLAQYCRDFVESQAKLSNFKSSYVLTLNQLINWYIEPAAGEIPMSKITLLDLKKIPAYMREQNICVEKINATIGFINRALADAAEDGGPLKRLLVLKKIQKSTKEVKKEVEPFTDAEIGKIMEASTRHLKPVLMMLAHTGMRPCEALALKWKDIDFSRKCIKVCHAIVHGEVSTTKTGATREIPMTDALEAVLLTHDHVPKSDYVFNKMSRYGSGPMDQEHVWVSWKKILAKAGVKHRPVYLLRHSFATDLMRKDVPLAAVSRLLGHTNIKTTSDRYVKLTTLSLDDVSKFHAAMEARV